MKVITIGRSSENDVVLNDIKASRVHCQIVQHDNGSFSVVDFGSTNGTYVNGVRVNGTKFLNWSDQVVVGDTDLQWQQYFKKEKSSTLPLVLGIVGGALVLIAVVLFLVFRNGGEANNTLINGVSLVCTEEQPQRQLLGRNVQDILQSTGNHLVEKHRTPGITNLTVNNVNHYTLNSYNYYLVDNTQAICCEDNDIVYEVCVWNPDFKTDRGICRGTTLGRVVEAYPSVVFSYLYYYYDYESSSYISVVYLFDEATCTGFIFKASAFSESQLQAIYAAVGGANVNNVFLAQSLNVSIYQSMCASVTLEQIVLRDCGQASGQVTEGPVEATEYVDLGLPSGTLWKSQNESGYYDYDEALQQFGSSLPTDAQLNELVSKCRWTWVGNGYRVDGPNGNSITIPADGIYGCDGSFDGKGETGGIWTSVLEDGYWAYSLNSNNTCVNVISEGRCCKMSVRLVKGGNSQQSRTTSTTGSGELITSSGSNPLLGTVWECENPSIYCKKNVLDFFADYQYRIRSYISDIAREAGDKEYEEVTEFYFVKEGRRGSLGGRKRGGYHPIGFYINNKGNLVVYPHNDPKDSTIYHRVK